MTVCNTRHLVIDEVTTIAESNMSVSCSQSSSFDHSDVGVYSMEKKDIV
jgi:hypothetical protein